MAESRTAGRLTKAETIARNLALDIAAGRFAPGTALDETEIAAHYGVSRTPIREAIRQLTASGLIESRAHRGAMVRTFDDQELDDMFAVMADLEALCARASAQAATDAEVDAMAEILDASRDAAATGDPEVYATFNDRFHDAIYRGAHNNCLMQMTLDIRQRLMPFRRAQFGAPGRLQRSLAEHEAVVAAIRLRDPCAAFEAMRAHIVVVRATVSQSPPPEGAL